MEFAEIFSVFLIGSICSSSVPEVGGEGVTETTSGTAFGFLVQERWLSFDGSHGNPSLFGRPPLTLQVVTTLLLTLGKILKDCRTP